MSNLVNITIDDTSPTFVYQPWGEGGAAGLPALSQGWSTYYDQLGYLSANGALPRGDSGSGNSYHVTGFDGASVSLTFHGSAVYVFGTSNCTYDIILDSSITTKAVLAGAAVGDTLAAFNGLDVGDHYLTLRAHPSNSSHRLALDRAIVTIDTAQSSTVNETEINNQDSTRITYSPAGSWWSSSDNGVPSPFYQTGNLSASASLSFTGHAVALYGSLNWGHQLYNVSIDGHPHTYNGSSYWKVGETLLYFQSGLDTTAPHTVELIDAVAAGRVSFTRALVWADVVKASSAAGPTNTTGGAGNSPAGAQSHHSNGGAIAGAVIGAVLLIAIIAAGVYYYLQRHSPKSSKLVTDIDPPSSTPYGAWKPEFESTSTVPWTTELLANGALSVTEATHSQASLYSPATSTSGIINHSTHLREKSGVASAIPPRSSPLSSTGSPAPYTTTPWEPSPAEQSSLGVNFDRRAQNASPLPAGASGPANAHVNLSSDTVEHLLQQLAARIDPATTPSASPNSAPPRYPTD